MVAPQHTCILLAGGKSRRMGRDKGLIEFQGKAMIRHLIDEFKPFSKELIIISSNEKYKKFGLPVYPDLIPDKGPMGGIYTGLSHSQSKENIVCSCDTPFLNRKLFRFLYERKGKAPVAVPSFRDEIHPLAGWYSRSVVNTTKDLIRNNELGMIRALKRFHAAVIEVDDREPFASDKLFANINDPGQLSHFNEA